MEENWPAWAMYEGGERRARSSRWGSVNATLGTEETHIVIMAKDGVIMNE